MGKYVKTTFELCPHCDSEVELQSKFKVQDCPNCKSPILPCSICKDMNCDKCPLETQEYRDKLIARTFNACFKDDSEDNRDSNISYLNSLTNMELSIKLNEQISYEDATELNFFDVSDENDD
jgi:hypothetical protein